MRSVAVIGGGVSGLATAWRLGKLAEEKGVPLRVRLFEKNHYFGGKMRTHREAGYTCEWGPNGFLDNKPWTVDLCREIGLDEDFLLSNDASRKRFIYSDRKLHRVPAKPLEFFMSRLLSLPGRLRIMLEPLAAPPRSDDETIHDFGTRRIGREAALKILNPMVSGVFAGATEVMSLKSAFPRIKELEDNYGGLIMAFLRLALEKRGKKSDPAKPKSGPGGPGGVLTSFERGVSELPARLGELLGVDATTSAVCEAAVPEKGAWRLFFDNGENELFDAAVLAVPSYNAAEILGDLDKELCSVLGRIPYAACTVTGLGFERNQLKHDLDAFGFLAPSREKLDILGCLFTSSIFPGRAPDGRVLLRVFSGGYRRPEIADWSEEKLVGRVLGDVGGILGIKGAPEFVRTFPFRRAIPQYTVGHSARLEAIGERLANHPGLYLAGNAYRGVSLNDCSRNSNLVAEEVLEYLSRAN